MNSINPEPKRFESKLTKMLRLLLYVEDEVSAFSRAWGYSNNCL